MEKLVLNQNQFAKFLFKIGLKIEIHSFDLFYDIKTITNKYKENLGKGTQPSKETIYLFYRNTGFDLCFEESDLFEIYLKNNTTTFKVVFCWNCDYWHKESFAVIEQIK